MEVALYRGLAGKARPLLELGLGEELPVLLLVEVCPSRLDIDHAFPAFALAAADHVHGKSGPLGGIEDGRSPLDLDLTVTGEEGNGPHLFLPLLVQKFADLGRITGTDQNFPAGCLLDPP